MRKFKHLIYKLGQANLIALLLFVILSPSLPVAAATPEEIKSILEGTTFYDPSASDSTACTTESPAGGGAVPAGNIPADTLAAINSLRPTYEQAANATKVPWQLLAAIHYRESGNSATKDLQAGNPFGGPYTQISTDYANYGYPRNLEESLEIAAKHLIASSHSGVVLKPINIANPDPEAVKDVLFSYNGRANAYAQQAADLGFNSTTQPYEGSPYVMNNYDAVHNNMKIITHDNGGLDGTDTRLGAFTLYSRLLGSTGGGQSPDNCGAGPCTPATNDAAAGGAADTGTCITGQGASAIVQEALNYAWSDNRGDPYCNEKPTYKTAIDAAVSAGQYTGANCNTNSSLHGIDCGGFVTRVVIDSGADPGYNYGGVPGAGASSTGGGQLPYLEANSGPNGKYVEIHPNGSTANLQPGDIAINGDHTFIYMGTQPGFDENSASASLGTRAPMARPAYFSNGAGDFRWFRLK